MTGPQVDIKTVAETTTEVVGMFVAQVHDWSSAHEQRRSMTRNEQGA